MDTLGRFCVVRDDSSVRVFRCSSILIFNKILLWYEGWRRGICVSCAPLGPTTKCVKEEKSTLNGFNVAL